MTPLRRLGRGRLRSGRSARVGWVGCRLVGLGRCRGCRLVARVGWVGGAGRVGGGSRWECVSSGRLSVGSVGSGLVGGSGRSARVGGDKAYLST